jgi:enamine deaminase RidA (YjgF/YER057c/UK114 family)
MSGIQQRLETLGISLPDAAAPAGSYVPYVISGDLVYVSGQLPMENGSLRYKGITGTDISLEDAAAAAKLCGLNLLAQRKEACGGNLDRVSRVVRLGGFVAAAPDFGNHPGVINGASNLMLEVFGESGRHARAAVGCASLPLGACVEIEGIFQLTE